MFSLKNLKSSIVQNLIVPLYNANVILYDKECTLAVLVQK